MNDDRIQRIVSSAVAQAYDDWAREHPALAAAINRMAVVKVTTDSLRQSQQYRQAVRQFHQDGLKYDLLDRIAELAGATIGRMFE